MSAHGANAHQRPLGRRAATDRRRRGYARMDTDNRTSPFIPEAADSRGTTAPRIRTEGRGQPDVTFYFGAADRTERRRRGYARTDTDDRTSPFMSGPRTARNDSRGYARMDTDD